MNKLYFFLLALIIVNSMNSQIILSHNEGEGPIDTIMFSCNENEYWARSFVLEDFGISTNSETIVQTGEIAFRTSYYGATAQFKIYAIDDNFPDSFPEATLLGSSQVEVIPYITYPQIMTINFTNPIVIPPNIERILVEVEKRDNPDSSSSSATYMAGSEFENDFSWYKGCGPNNTYTITGELNLPRPNANFIINIIVDDPLSIDDITSRSFAIYPNPTQNILRINSVSPFNAFKIYSVKGNIEIEGFSNETIDVSQLSSGVYFIQVIIEGKTLMKKFVKK